MSRTELLHVALPAQLVLELLKRYPTGFEEIVEYAVESFLERTHDDFYQLSKQSIGMKWGHIFFPSGTQLRTKYFGEYIYAEVLDNYCLWGNEKYTSIPDMLNKMRGNTMNNAWKFLEVKIPNANHWKPADSFRKI